MFQDIRNYKYWARSWLSDYESIKCEFEFVYVIVVTFGLKHGYMIPGAHFKSIRDDLSILEMSITLGFMNMHEHGWFLNQIWLFFGSN